MVVEDETRQKLTDSSFIELIIDELTDIFTDKKLSIFAKVVSPKIGEAETIYVKDVDVDNGKRDHIYETVVNVLSKDFEILVSKVFAFGSDGTAAMVGKK